MSPSRRIVAALNPSASSGRGRLVGPRVVEALRAAGHEVTALAEADFAALLAATRAALADGADALVVVGGDGMVHLGLLALAGGEVPLGLVPSGTGNDVARGLGIPIDDTEAAIAALLAALEHPAQRIDTATITGDGIPASRFACILSAGFDALVNERANGMRRPRGRSRYTIALLVELLRLRPIDYRLVLDGVEYRERGVLVAIANNRSFGGGMLVAPDAQLDDGLLDVVVVRPLGRLAFLRIYPRVFAGTHVSDPRVVVHRAARVRIEAQGVVAYADGERIGPLPLDIAVEPGALRVLA
ncbi:diacylglycerol kinase family protein [Microcella daejeonensis]|uniref:Diacylglycerol kinase family protein n=1 Tax=Microcella daejeonensis TaxID=2994971 RepID=A0A9E8MLI0_9MICO|nr:diacylglycerol kinase family protein [Microcella daejeonensis]WAB81716.1 diacylglycerol kinase family protein [Microcella daejeonensis]